MLADMFDILTFCWHLVGLLAGKVSWKSLTLFVWQNIRILLGHSPLLWPARCSSHSKKCFVTDFVLKKGHGYMIQSCSAVWIWHSILGNVGCENEVSCTPYNKSDSGSVLGLLLHKHAVFHFCDTEYIIFCFVPTFCTLWPEVFSNYLLSSM